MITIATIRLLNILMGRCIASPFAQSLSLLLSRRHRATLSESRCFDQHVAISTVIAVAPTAIKHCDYTVFIVIPCLRCIIYDRYLS